MLKKIGFGLLVFGILAMIIMAIGKESGWIDPPRGFKELAVMVSVAMVPAVLGVSLFTWGVLRENDSAKE